MKSSHSFFAGSKYTLLIILFFTTSTFAQAPMYYNYNTMGNGNSFPFSVVAGKLVQELILPGEFNQPTAAPSGTITKFYIYCATASITYTNLTIKMHQDTITNLPSSGFYTEPMDTVYYSPSVTITSTNGTFTPIILNKTFCI